MEAVLKTIRVLKWFWAPSLLLLSGCEHVIVKRDYYPDGRPAEEQAFIAVPEDDYRVPHGYHQTWYPNGSMKGLEVFVHGVRQGNAFHWDEKGRLTRLDFCVNDVCKPKASSPDFANTVASLP